ncbi:MAG: type II toxin-antitoxin system VapC family toxin [Gemmataceae bacterium]|nr:type II toxin-antitoxin system VapC family toxin [Gemmataceae bacterium]
MLIDTHVLLWLDSNAARLSQTAVGYLTNPSCRLLQSTASVWELAIKVSINKLVLRADLATIVADQTTRNPISLLPVAVDHALAVRSLPPIHKDPFDRMLVAQALAENAVLLTDDPVIRQYPVRTDW